MNMHLFLWVAIALFAGLIFTRVFKALHWNFPDVTAFLIAGLLIGPFCLGRLGIAGVGFSSFEELDRLSLINDAALGFIAFSIGSEFRLSELKKTGKAATVIGIAQALIACLLVDLALYVMYLILGPEVLPLPVVITLGAIATATAPAATLMVVRQYKADGPLTRLLLPIVALDDAVGLVVFSVSLGIAKALQGGSYDMISIVVNPLLEILFSLILGGVLGFILARLERLFFSNSNRLSMTISFVLLTIALSFLEIPLGPVTISFSSLLVCMMLGTVFCNACEYSADIMNKEEKWTSPLNATFFVLSGAALDFSVFSNYIYVVVGVVYILFRSLGKYFGARESSRLMGCDRNVVTYLGITLLPQAGVALGMCSKAAVLGGLDASVIHNVTLFGVLVYELAGPLMTRNALMRAGEISDKPKEKQSRTRFSRSAAKS